MGVTVLSKAPGGAPRLLRAVVPRKTRTAMTPDAAARDHLAALAPLWVKNARPMPVVDAGTQQLRNGASVVRLAQQIDGIDVHDGELRVLVHPDGSLAAVSGTLVPATGKPAFRSSPSEAATRALDRLYGAGRAPAAITEGAEQHGWHKLSITAAGNYQVEEARAKPELFERGGRLVAVWSVEITGTRTNADLEEEPTAHRYLVADDDGAILRDADLIAHDSFLYRTFAESGGLRRPTDGASESFAPHPTGVPDGSLPPFARQNLVVMESFNRSHDPWLPPNATTASGNNATAVYDRSNGSISRFPAEVTTGRILNYVYDSAQEPLATTTQSKAAVVNTFFLTNWMHDWWYDSGFTELTGNAQVSNYGRGGVEGDPVLIISQSGSVTGSRNNASMSTPADGRSPVMRMFLFASDSETSLTTPSGTPTTSYVHTGPRNFDLTGDLVAINDGVEPSGDGCEPITTDLTGKIAYLAWTNLCPARIPIQNAMARGAIAAVYKFPTGTTTVRPFAASANAPIPALVVSDLDGRALATSLATAPLRVTLHRSSPTPERDGDLDNSIVAHEWGHYLHHRLASCSVGLQCASMSEGWGDFNAMLMMVREGDARGGVYGTGVYALGGGAQLPSGLTDPGYFGIRRYPYSTDHTKNPLSFRHIGDANELPFDVPVNPPPAAIFNSEVHNAGEVWAAMLFEAYNALIDAHGVTSAQRRISDYVVAGLLLTPPEATYTEGRDAILSATGALDSDDMLLMAAGFANRGAGSCAASPSNNNLFNDGVVESATIAANLEVGALRVADDTASCDRDGYLDRGERGQVRLTLANGGVIDAEDVVITATTTTPGVTLGAPIRLGALARFSNVQLAIPVAVSASAQPGATLAIDVKIASAFTCKRELVVPLRVPLGVDEVAAVSTIDRVETKLTPWALTGDGAAEEWSRSNEVSGNHVWHAAGAGTSSDTQLTSPLLDVGTQPLVVKVSHAFDFEAGGGFLFDGGVVEVSADNGATWVDVGNLGANPGYNGAIDGTQGNPLGGRVAFTAQSEGFPARSVVAMNFGTQFAGKSIRLRFRVGSDACCVATGWDIDDIEVLGITNTPFPALVNQPGVCRAPRANSDAEPIARAAWARASLRAFEAKD